MPLYLGVVAMCTMRDSLLECKEMHEAHVALSHIDLTALAPLGDATGCRSPGSLAGESKGENPLEVLIRQAVALMDRFPPKALLDSR